MPLNDSKNDLYGSSVRLCNAVESEPCIYDRNNEHYAAKWAVSAAWVKVATICKDTPANCKSRWSHIRTAFTRASYGSKKRPANRNRDYYLQDELKFLEPHIWNFNNLDSEDHNLASETTSEESGTSSMVKKTKYKEAQLSAKTASILSMDDDTVDSTFNENSESSDDVNPHKNDEESLVNKIENFFIQQTKSGNANIVGKKSLDGDKRKGTKTDIQTTSNTTVATMATKSSTEFIGDPLEQPTRVLRASKRTLDKSLEQKNNKNSNIPNESSSSKTKDTKNKSGGKMQSEAKRRRPALRYSSTPTKQNKSHSRKLIGKKASSETPKESKPMLRSVSVSASASSLSSSFTTEASPKTTTGNEKTSKVLDDTKPKVTGVYVISPTKPAEESETLPLSSENTEPDYFEDLLILAETKAREFEAEELLRANAPVFVDQSIQCKMLTTDRDVQFMEHINDCMLDMNARQKMRFKQNVYKSLIDVFDCATDFPTTEQVVPSNDSPTSLLEKNLQPKEIWAMRELLSLVLAIKKTPELTNSTSGAATNTENVSGLAISNASTGFINSINRQVVKATLVSVTGKPTTSSAALLSVVGPTSASTSISTSGSGSGSGIAAANATVSSSGNVAAGGVSELNLPAELLNEAIKISVNGGGSITATDGNKRRVYRIYPRASPVNRAPTQAAATNLTTTNAGTFIVPQTSSNNNTAHSTSTTTTTFTQSTTTANSTTTATAGIPSQCTAATSRPITISARPVVINQASLGVGATIPTMSLTTPPKLVYNRPNDTTINQTAVTIRRLTQNQHQSESQNSAIRTLPTLQPAPNLIQTLRAPVRRYSLCNPQTFSNYHNSQLMVPNYNDGPNGRISPTIITTTIHGTPFSQSISTSQENSRRMNEPMVSFKRARYPHVTQSTNVHGTHGIATSRIIGPSATYGSAPNAGYTTATATSTTKPFLAAPSLLKPVPVIIRSSTGTNTNANTNTNTDTATTSVPRTVEIKAKTANNKNQSLNASAGIITADEFPVKDEPLDEELDFPSLLL